MLFQNLKPEIITAAKRVKLLLMDCDGVLTDGRLYFTESGETMKVFHVRDGQGLALWHSSGFRSGIISGRGAGEIISRRAEELGIDYVRTGSKDKTRDFQEILDSTGLFASETAFIGDDLGDVEIMKIVGLPIAVADSVDDVKSAALYVTTTNGGYGVVREVTDLLLKAKVLTTESSQQHSTNG